jgi:hypothetical protein
MAERAEDAGLLVERLAASLAHAVAGPLSLVTGRAELLARDTDSAELRERIQRVVEPVGRALELVEHARRFGAGLREEHADRELHEELDALERAATDFQRSGPAIVIERDGPGTGSVAAGAVVRIVRHLAIFAGARGALRLEVHARALEIVLEPDPDRPLPSTRRALLDPWLDGAVADGEARLALALAIALVIAQGGEHELAFDGDRVRNLLLRVPLRA